MSTILDVTESLNLILFLMRTFDNIVIKFTRGIRKLFETNLRDLRLIFSELVLSSLTDLSKSKTSEREVSSAKILHIEVIQSKIIVALIPILVKLQNYFFSTQMFDHLK